MTTKLSNWRSFVVSDKGVMCWPRVAHKALVLESICFISWNTYQRFCFDLFLFGLYELFIVNLYYLFTHVLEIYFPGTEVIATTRMKHWTLSQSSCTALTTGICILLGLCKGTVIGVWKTVGISTGHVSPQCTGTLGYPNLSIFRPTNHKAWCQPFGGHSSCVIICHQAWTV